MDRASFLRQPPAWVDLRRLLAGRQDHRRGARHGLADLVHAGGGAPLLLLDARTGRVLWARRYPMRPGQQGLNVAFTRRRELVTSAPARRPPISGVRVDRPDRAPVPYRRELGLPPDGRRAALGRNSPEPGRPERSSDRARPAHRRTPHARRSASTTAWISSHRVRGRRQERHRELGRGGMKVWDIASGSITPRFTGKGQRGAPPSTRAVGRSSLGARTAASSPGTSRASDGSAEPSSGVRLRHGVMRGRRAS